MCPDHLPGRQLIGPMPRDKLDTLIVILQCVLDDVEQRVCLGLVDTYVISDDENDFPDFFLLAVAVVLFVFVEGDGHVDAGYGGPGGVDGEPVCGMLDCTLS